MKMRWTDKNGVRHEVAPLGRPLSPGKIASHAALRAHVYHRDGYICRRCGLKAEDIPEQYDGRTNLYVTRIGLKKRDVFCLVMDHIIPRKHGGDSHPSNLQTLCQLCSTIKRNRNWEYANRNTASYRERFNPP
jgi:5-methylcytosine-specific restriction endonuclease McrA